MEKNKKYVRKSFFVHQYEKEEAFLSDMRAKGWKFVKLHKGIPTKYEFDACEPEEYSYCLDYISEEEDTEDYHQLYKDAGWEEVLPWDGVNGKWYYFCKKNINGEKQVIFTDVDSKLQLMDKLFHTFGVFFLTMILTGTASMANLINLMGDKTHSFWFYLTIPIVVLCFCSTIMLSYYEIGMYFEKRKLKKQEEERL